jgi:8-oxo-dGTP diphosphatase
MKKYVLGFYFLEGTFTVVLIRKTRPSWCRGKLNGLGGSIEPNETPVQAMVREFKEESGISTTIDQWSPWMVLAGDNWVMDVFVGEGKVEGLIKECDEGSIEMHFAFSDKEQIDSTARALLMLLWDSKNHNYEINKHIG